MTLSYGSSGQVIPSDFHERNCTQLMVIFSLKRQIKAWKKISILINEKHTFQVSIQIGMEEKENHEYKTKIKIWDMVSDRQQTKNEICLISIKIKRLMLMMLYHKVSKTLTKAALKEKSECIKLFGIVFIYILQTVWSLISLPFNKGKFEFESGLWHCYTNGQIYSAVVEEIYVHKKLKPTGPIGQFENFSKFPWQPARVHCSLAHPESNWLMICKFKETEAKVKKNS